MIGEIASQTAVEVAGKLADNPEIRNDFKKAEGDTEFSADGTFVHILNDEDKAEWKEVKVGALAKRERGESAAQPEWNTRTLPEPTVVSAFAAIEGKEEFQERCQAERRRLGVGGVSSALGDGAKWIWNLVGEVFGKTEECLDVFHGAEHISDCGKVLFGESQAKKEWFERRRLVLIAEGFSGVERELKLLLGLKEKQQSAGDSLVEYLRNNAQRLNDCERLALGRAIGSGLIEGACKNLVGRRLKQTGACWRLTRANRIAILCALLYSRQWQYAWKTPKKL